MKFAVTIYEVHSATIQIEATTKEEAKKIALEHIQHAELDTHYNYTLEPDEWYAEPIDSED